MERSSQATRPVGPATGEHAWRPEAPNGRARVALGIVDPGIGRAAPGSRGSAGPVASRPPGAPDEGAPGAAARRPAKAAGAARRGEAARAPRNAAGATALPGRGALPGAPARTGAAGRRVGAGVGPAASGRTAGPGASGKGCRQQGDGQ